MIPQNTYNKERVISKAIDSISEQLSSRWFAVYHCIENGIDIALAKEIAEILKGKGWFVYKLVRFDGTLLDIQVFGKPQQNDFGHLNTFSRM